MKRTAKKLVRTAGLILSVGRSHVQ